MAFHLPQNVSVSFTYVLCNKLAYFFFLLFPRWNDKKTFSPVYEYVKPSNPSYYGRRLTYQLSKTYVGTWHMFAPRIVLSKAECFHFKSSKLKANIIIISLCASFYDNFIRIRMKTRSSFSRCLFFFSFLPSASATAYSAISMNFFFLYFFFSLSYFLDCIKMAKLLIPT